MTVQPPPSVVWSQYLVLIGSMENKNLIKAVLKIYIFLPIIQKELVGHVEMVTTEIRLLHQVNAVVQKTSFVVTRTVTSNADSKNN